MWKGILRRPSGRFFFQLFFDVWKLRLEVPVCCVRVKFSYFNTVSQIIKATRIYVLFHTPTTLGLIYQECPIVPKVKCYFRQEFVTKGFLKECYIILKCINWQRCVFTWGSECRGLSQIAWLYSWVLVLAVCDAPFLDTTPDL